MPDFIIASPLVSVIIPCYNQAHFLTKSIDSVLTQQYSPIEIVVVDDGSTDNTREVAATFQRVKYVYQQNAGLSAARNTGIDNSNGEFLVFLDSDDWLLPDAIQTNVKYLQENPKAVFVSGSHIKVGPDGTIPETRTQITLLPYHQLLHQNYIGMIAAVMFRRQILNQFRYDTSLKSCEDYDLYLRITRDHQVVNHLKEIAAYRIHGSSMSGNLPRMLEIVSKVLRSQEDHLRDPLEKGYLAAGLDNWKKFYCKKYYQQLNDDISNFNPASLQTLSVFQSGSPVYFQWMRFALLAKYFFYRTKRWVLKAFRS